MNLVSVVIPSFNHAAYIRHAVESVLNQSYTNLELIVIDDGSTDNSLSYLQSVKDDRYSLIIQANAGAHNAINRGLSLAKGSYLAILNSDDIFHPQRLKECIRQLEQGADLVATWIEIIDTKGNVLGIKEGWNNMLPWQTQPIDSNLGTIDEFTINLLATNFVSTTSNVVFKRSVYEETQGMRNLRFVHDWDFLLQAARKFKCELLNKPLLQYRIHNSNTISSNRAWMLFEICWIFSVHLEHFSSRIFDRDTKGANTEIEFLANSINLQGNDKVLRMLLQYFDIQKQKGNLLPEETLINNKELRESFIKHIIS